MIQSVQRAAQILAVLGSGTPRLGVTEIAERVGLAKPTVHGLLAPDTRDELVREVLGAARAVSRDLGAGRGGVVLSALS